MKVRRKRQSLGIRQLRNIGIPTIVLATLCYWMADISLNSFRPPYDPTPLGSALWFIFFAPFAMLVTFFVPVSNSQIAAKTEAVAIILYGGLLYLCSMFLARRQYGQEYDKKFWKVLLKCFIGSAMLFWLVLISLMLLNA